MSISKPNPMKFIEFLPLRDIVQSIYSPGVRQDLLESGHAFNISTVGDFSDADHMNVTFTHRFLDGPVNKYEATVSYSGMILHLTRNGKDTGISCVNPANYREYAIWCKSKYFSRPYNSLEVAETSLLCNEVLFKRFDKSLKWYSHRTGDEKRYINTVLHAEVFEPAERTYTLVDTGRDNTESFVEPSTTKEVLEQIRGDLEEVQRLIELWNKGDLTGPIHDF